MKNVWISIGSNLSNPIKQVELAISKLDKIPYTYLISYSSYYRSVPLGKLMQPEYLNVVVKLKTNLSPENFLKYLQNIENQQGRLRYKTKRWYARTIDLDILIFEGITINTNTLCVPHYDLKNRNFILYPLYEISPDLNFFFRKNILLKDYIKQISSTYLEYWSDKKILKS